MSNQSNVVVFDYPSWAARYPEFNSVPQNTVQAYFNEAQLYCDNSPVGLVPNCAPVFQRAQFLNMLTAHITMLNAVINGQPSSPLVGRINSATEGSVSVQTQLDYPAGSPQWYAQSKYGIAYWQASSSFRTMRYVPGPRPNFNPYGLNIVRL